MVESAWGWLSDQQRALLRGRYWDGLSVEQVAEGMSLAVADAARAEAAALLLCRRVIGALFEADTGEPLPALRPA